jgi:hypothetical protein
MDKNEKKEFERSDGKNYVTTSKSACVRYAGHGDHSSSLYPQAQVSHMGTNGLQWVSHLRCSCT